MHSRLSTRQGPLARLTASLAVVLVLALSVFAASPELHGYLHDHAGSSHAGDPQQPGDQGHDDGCVVTLFAQGLLAVAGLFVLALAGRTLPAAAFAAVRRVRPPLPAFLHLPPQAPPARA